MLEKIITFLNYINPEGEKPYNSYSTDELSAMSFLGRVKIYNWGIEKYTIGFTLIFILLFKIGDWWNQSLVTKWLAAHKKVLDEEFAQVGVTSKDLYLKDDAENYSSYATGRDNIARLNIDFRLKPRHNIFVYIMETFLNMFFSTMVDNEEKVTITITPSTGDKYDNFIFGVVSKEGLNDHRTGNYFLSLTRTTDSAKLPQEFVFMSEAADVTESVFTEELSEAIVGTSSFLKFVAATDQPIEKPSSLGDLVPFKKIIFASKIASSAKDLEKSSKILHAAIHLADHLAANGKFRPETRNRIQKTRDAEAGKIKRAIEEVKNEELAEKKLQEKREARDKLSKLSREDQLKIEKKQKDKQQRKLKNKQKVRQG